MLVMKAPKLLLLNLVVFCLSLHIEAWTFSTEFLPENKVEIIKSLLKFDFDYITKRWWSTEDRTCSEVEKVLQILTDNVHSDLGLLMKDAESHLILVPPPRDKKLRKCIGEIREKIEETIQEGVDYFSECTAISKIIQSQVKKRLSRERTKYQENINYTIENIDQCLQYSTKSTEDLWNRCIELNTNTSLNQFNITSTIYSESNCMIHFTNDILNCTSRVLNKTAVKKRSLRYDLKQCLGYSYINYFQEERSYGLYIKYMLSNYMDAYKSLSDGYDVFISKYYSNICQGILKQEEDLKLFHRDDVNKYLLNYYESLNKTWEENRSVEERKCYTAAIEKLSSLVSQGFIDYKECAKSGIQQKKQGLDTFTDIVKNFNAKLKEAGNVALLGCFGERPQLIFNATAIGECAKLTRKSIDWEWGKVVVKFSNLNTYLELSQVRENDTTCGQLRYSKLILDADKIMSECSRCLSGKRGDWYAVTPDSNTTEITTKQQLRVEDVTEIENEYGLIDQENGTIEPSHSVLSEGDDNYIYNDLYFSNYP